MWDGQSCFTWCKRVLEQYPFSRREMDARRKEIQEGFFGREKVNYESDLTHCAYIKSDVTFHACAISAFIRRNPELRCLFLFGDEDEYGFPLLGRRDTVSIASVGCGPGTDMIGVLRYLFENPNMNPNFNDPEKRPNLKFYLFDSTCSWTKAIERFSLVIRRRVKSKYDHVDGFPHTPPLEFQYCFQPWDLTRDPSEFHGVRNFESVGLFIFSMVFSGILRTATTSNEFETVTRNLQIMCDEAKAGSLFLFMDLQTGGIGQFQLDSFLRKTALAGKNFQCLFSNLWTYQLDPREDKRDLGNYFSDGADGWSPKLSMTFNVNLYRKKQQQLA